MYFAKGREIRGEHNSDDEEGIHKEGKRKKNTHKEEDVNLGFLSPFAWFKSRLRLYFDSSR